MKATQKAFNTHVWMVTYNNKKELTKDTACFLNEENKLVMGTPGNTLEWSYNIFKL